MRNYYRNKLNKLKTSIHHIPEKIKYRFITISKRTLRIEYDSLPQRRYTIRVQEIIRLSLKRNLLQTLSYWQNISKK